MSMNIELLKQVATKLRRMRHRRHFDMDLFVEKNDCGTAACIGGHALLMNGYKPNLMCHLVNVNDIVADDDREFISPNGQKVSAFNSVRKVLGLTQKQAERLFLSEQWPEQFKEDYNNPKVAAARIDHFIQTGGKE